MIKILLLAAFGVIAGTGAVINAIWGPRARARRRLERGMREVTEGEIVTVVGKARVIGEPLIAPLSGRACVAYEACMNEGVLRDVQLTPFELVAESGVFVVDGDYVDFALPIVPLIPRKLEREQAFLEAHGRHGLDAAQAGFQEVVVEPGDKIAVQGMIVVEHATGSEERGYREAHKRVRIAAYEGHRITIGRP